ncbi:MAG TPA: molecular chaperone TorD family protein [Planctomycetota bacterium]|nr:molecular chaperone TorD family protein [Planctomycetota bacterium]
MEKQMSSDPVCAALYRSLVYRFLALSLNYPSAGRAADIRRIGGVVLEDSKGFLPDELRVRLCEELAGLTEESLIYKYDQCFGHAVRGPIPIYEAEYGTEQDVFQQSQEIADIAAFYAAAGLKRRSDVRERADHLGLELELGQVLTRRLGHGIEAAHKELQERSEEMLKMFLRDHLARKGLSVFKRMARDGDFFGAIGDLGQAFLTSECAHYGIVPEPPTLTLRPAMVGMDEELRCGVGAAAAAPRPPELEV